MVQFGRTLTRLYHDERGTTSIEYALIGVLISIVVIGAATAIGTDLEASFYRPVLAGFR